MKLTKYGLLLGALGMLASCSNDAIDSPNVNGPTSVKGDMYMSLNIQPVGTRADTQTPNQGVEVGKNEENKITSAIIVLATSTDAESFNVWKTFPIGVGDIDASGTATFQYDRATLINEVKGGEQGSGTSKDVYVFVVANPTVEISSAFSGSTVQQTINLDADGNDWWTADKFLMSNKELYKATIILADIEEGHETVATAYPLEVYENGTEQDATASTVKIQRAMSRFDVDASTTYTDFTVGENELSVKIDALALVNQATVAELFKVTHSDPFTFVSGTTLSFTDETYNNYVWSAKQKAFTHPLFNGDASVNTGVLTGSAQFPELFANADDYITVEALREKDQDNTFTYPNGGGNYANDVDYHIWRYVMENTNYDSENQLRGNSTGIVFRAEITGTKVPTPTVGNEAIYAYNNVIFGDADALFAYACTPKSDDDETSVYEAVAMRYQAAIDAAIEDASLGNWTTDKWAKKKAYLLDQLKEEKENLEDETSISLSDLDSKLVAQKFTIYRPTQVEGGYKYYCYYVYYNRHNNNGDNLKMGPMEFATVRNNIYKIKVTDIAQLGHPGVVTDDPEPEKPDDPVEKDKFYFSVTCEVVDWEVRLNDVQF